MQSTDYERPQSDIAQEYLDYFKGFYKDFCRSGSRVICTPPVLDTDDDYILLCEDVEIAHVLMDRLSDEGFDRCGDEEYEGNALQKDGTYTFAAYRKDDLNWIITANKEYFDGFVKATKLATALNLTKKEDRVKLFRVVAKQEDLDE